MPIPASFNPPTYCKVNNFQYRITLQGLALNISGFGYPVAARILRFDEMPPEGVPLVPEDSTGAPLANSADVDVDPDDGTWSFTTQDLVCTDDDPARVVAYVLWTRYANFTSVHVNVEVLLVPLKKCADVPGLNAC